MIMSPDGAFEPWRLIFRNRTSKVLSSITPLMLTFGALGSTSAYAAGKSTADDAGIFAADIIQRRVHTYIFIGAGFDCYCAVVKARNL
jgi:hypothetical protein